MIKGMWTHDHHNHTGQNTPIMISDIFKEFQFIPKLSNWGRGQGSVQVRLHTTVIAGSTCDNSVQSQLSGVCKYTTDYPHVQVQSVL